MDYSTQILKSIPFGELIGNPMKAAIEAQSMAAQSTVEFIQAVGFASPQAYGAKGNPLVVDDNPNIGDVRYVAFSYKTYAPDGSQQEVLLKVPLLTIVPIPYLRIEEMTIDFRAKITEEIKNDSSNSGQTTYESNYNQSLRDRYSSETSFKATVSSINKNTTSASSRYQTEFGMDLNIKAVQDDMPFGLSRILNVLETSIQETRTDIPKTKK